MKGEGKKEKDEREWGRSPYSTFYSINRCFTIKVSKTLFISNKIPWYDLFKYAVLMGFWYENLGLEVL